MDHYGVLGVPPRASHDEITHAYRALAKAFHPDQHPGASAAAKTRYQDAMAQINHAHSVLKDPERRQAYDASLADAAVSDTWRRPESGECVLCGHAPAANFEFSYQNAWIIRATRYTQSLSMCRSCAQSLGRAHQNRTLITGWWGVLSFFRNLAVVFSNGRQLRQARSMAVPLRVPDVAAPLSDPLDVGRPVFKRSGVYVAVAVFAVLGVMGASEKSTSDAAAQADGGIYADSGGTDTTPPIEDVRWEVGGCVQGTDSLEAVDCSEPNDGDIIDSVSSRESCPTAADSYVEDGDIVWCIQTATAVAQPVAWEIGGCVQGTDSLEAVDCSEPHDGEIVDLVLDQNSCPASTDSYVEDGADVWCIDATT